MRDIACNSSMKMWPSAFTLSQRQHLDMLTSAALLTFSFCTVCITGLSVEELQCKRIGYSTVNPSTPDDLYLIPEDLAAVECSTNGHWPLKKSCKSSKSGIFFDIEQRALFISGHHDKLVQTEWNISSNVEYSPICAATVSSAIFMPIAFDEAAYQTEGSNYYVTHMDSLIPLWNVLQKLHKKAPRAHLPEIFLFAFNVQGEVDLESAAFDDYSKYWIQSLQLLLGDVALQLGTVSGFSSYLNWARSDGYGAYISGRHSPGRDKDGRSSGWGSEGGLCFREVLLGAPQFHPSRRAVRGFSRDFRMAVLRHSPYAFSAVEDSVSSGVARVSDTDTASRLLCSSVVKKVGIVVRKGRRKIANLDSFMGGLEEVGARWCRTALLSGRCEVQFRGEEFGLERGGREGRGSGSSSSSVERDIVPLQEYAVLFGIQGSGLINALYMPPVSSAVAVYLNDGWPISSADPLALLGDRGPYIAHINTDPSKIICNLTTDKFCDSGDMIMDVEVFAPVIEEALNQHLKECESMYDKGEQ